jgi:hypothetical protein
MTLEPLLLIPLVSKYEEGIDANKDLLDMTPRITFDFYHLDFTSHTLLSTMITTSYYSRYQRMDKETPCRAIVGCMPGIGDVKFTKKKGNLIPPQSNDPIKDSTEGEIPLNFMEGGFGLRYNEEGTHVY